MSTVPVEGAQVMLNGVPAVTVLRVVNVKGFWALVRAASAALKKMAENCILTSANSSEDKKNAGFLDSRRMVGIKKKCS